MDPLHYQSQGLAPVPDQPPMPPQAPAAAPAPIPTQDQAQEWRNKRYRYHITLTDGREVQTNYYDSYNDLENWIRSGAAGVLTPNGFVELPPAVVKSIQPIEEGQAQGQQPPEREVAAPPAAPPAEDAAAAGPLADGQGVATPEAGTTIQPNASEQPQTDSEGTLQIPRD